MEKADRLEGRCNKYIITINNSRLPISNKLYTDGAQNGIDALVRHYARSPDIARAAALGQVVVEERFMSKFDNPSSPYTFLCRYATWFSVLAEPTGTVQHIHKISRC